MSDVESQEETQRYIAIPKYKNCFYEVGHYTKHLSTDKYATLKCTTDWRWGECIIEITEKERKDILQSQDVCLTDYCCEFSESTTGYSGDCELEDKDSFTKKEMKEIIGSIKPGEESDEEEDTEKVANCDLCCKDKSFENYYVFKRGRKQELYSCVKCWENRETQLVNESSWTWTHHTFPGPAFFIIDKDGDEKNKCDQCNIELDRYRDGSTGTYIRCNNCYWENQQGKDSVNIIKPDYREKHSKNEDEQEDNGPTVCSEDCACNIHSKSNNEDDDTTTISINEYDTEFMEEYGDWNLDETYYYIHSGVVLVPEDEDIEDYAQDDGTYANKEENPQKEEDTQPEQDVNSVFMTICGGVIRST